MYKHLKFTQISFYPLWRAHNRNFSINELPVLFVNSNILNTIWASSEINKGLFAFHEFILAPLRIVGQYARWRRLRTKIISKHNTAKKNSDILQKWGWRLNNFTMIPSKFRFESQICFPTIKCIFTAQTLIYARKF